MPSNHCFHFVHVILLKSLASDEFTVHVCSKTRQADISIHDQGASEENKHGGQCGDIFGDIATASIVI